MMMMYIQLLIVVMIVLRSILNILREVGKKKSSPTYVFLQERSYTT